MATNQYSENGEGYLYEDGLPQICQKARVKFIEDNYGNAFTILRDAFDEYDRDIKRKNSHEVKPSIEKVVKQTSKLIELLSDSPTRDYIQYQFVMQYQSKVHDVNNIVEELQGLQAMAEKAKAFCTKIGRHRFKAYDTGLRFSLKAGKAYKILTGKEPGRYPRGNLVGGPFPRFLKECFLYIGEKKTEEEISSFVKGVKNHALKLRRVK